MYTEAILAVSIAAVPLNVVRRFGDRQVRRSMQKIAVPLLTFVAAICVCWLHWHVGNDSFTHEGLLLLAFSFQDGKGISCVAASGHLHFHALQPRCAAQWR